MSRRDGRRNRRTDTRPPRCKENEPAVDEDCPVIKLFRGYQHQLDRRHDKYERIVKLSRDITIESKRIIFLLHRMSAETMGTILQDAEDKLKDLREEKWRQVADELQEEDHHQYLRAYTAGLQEYIEAISFWQFLKEKTLISVAEVETGLRFTRPAEIKEESTTTTTTDNPTVAPPVESTAAPTEDADKSTVSQSEPEKTDLTHVLVPPTHYLLGIADLTGELMRMAIHSIGEGDFDLPFEHCKFLRIIHDAFVSYGNVDRELSRKVHVLRQSLQKVETACYTLQVRGSEIPKHMLAEAFSKSTADDLLSEEAASSGGNLGY